MKDAYYFDPRNAAEYDAEEGRGEVATDDIPFYVSLARECAAQGLPVLELGAGTGRVTIPMAQAGARVVGLDRSPAMLEVARRKSDGIEDLRWVEGDMADFALDERFGLVVIPFRSFLLLLAVAEQKACLACIREHLVPGGRLALNVFNPDLVAMASWLSTKRGLRQRVESATDESRRIERWETREYATAEQLHIDRHIEDELADDGAVIARVYKDLRLRWVYRYEMEHLLALSGFEIEALCGWFDGRPFTDESQEMVWLARRPQT